MLEMTRNYLRDLADEIRECEDGQTVNKAMRIRLPVNSRVDWNVSDRLQIFGVFALDKHTFLLGSNASSPYAGFSTGALTDNYNIQVAGTYQLTNNFVGVSRFTLNRLLEDQPLGDQPAGPTLYLRQSAQRLGGTRIAFPGYLPFSPGSAIPFGGPQNDMVK